MIAIHDFIWDETNIEHIAQHHVNPREAEEVFESRYYLRRLWDDRYASLGRTDAGRYLFVAFDYNQKDKSVYVATARDMDEKERKLYRRRS